jgi:hypothetical protein
VNHVSLDGFDGAIALTLSTGASASGTAGGRSNSTTAAYKLKIDEGYELADVQSLGSSDTAASGTVDVTSSDSPTLIVSANSVGTTTFTINVKNGTTGMLSGVNVDVVVVGIEFLGGSLRVNSDGRGSISDASQTALRLGYKVTFPAGVDMNSVALGWNYGFSGVEGALPYSKSATNTIVEGNSVTANLVFTNLSAANYARELAAEMFVGCVYNGQQLTWLDTACERSVLDIANAITNSNAESTVNKTYVANLKSAYEAITKTA